MIVNLNCLAVLVLAAVIRVQTFPVLYLNQELLVTLGSIGNLTVFRSYQYQSKSPCLYVRQVGAFLGILSLVFSDFLHDIRSL